MTNIRSGWRSSMLKKPFERTIVGFDLRRSSSLNRLFMTAYDDSVRYEDIYENWQDQLSGLNLFYSDPTCIPALAIPADAVVIAFDLPAEFVTYLSMGTVSSPEPLPSAGLGKDWAFIGFDVVDAITQISAFYGMDRTPSELEWIAKNLKFNFNDNGLIDKEEIALKGAKFFDQLVMEHAPFSPCGIWLKHGMQGMGSAIHRT